MSTNNSTHQTHPARSKQRHGSDRRSLPSSNRFDRLLGRAFASSASFRVTATVDSISPRTVSAVEVLGPGDDEKRGAKEIQPHGRAHSVRGVLSCFQHPEHARTRHRCRSTGGLWLPCCLDRCFQAVPSTGEVTSSPPTREVTPNLTLGTGLPSDALAEYRRSAP